MGNTGGECDQNSIYASHFKTHYFV
jgi:hypothetical protein